MKKNKKKRSAKVPFRRILLLALAIYLSALVIPFLSHKEVSDAFRRQFEKRAFYNDTPGAERVAHIPDNTDALLLRLRMIEEAQDEIILSTFDFNADRSGREVMSSLLHAAERGVSVRVIVDGASGFLDMRKNPWFQALASHENVSIRIYNPIHFGKPWKLQARLHDKYLIIDNSMYVLGGRNTTNLFLGDYSSAQNIDWELFVYEDRDSGDSSLSQLSSYFEEVWTLPDSREFTCPAMTEEIQECLLELKDIYNGLKETYPQSYEPWDWKKFTMETNRISLLCNPVTPDNKEPWMWYALNQLMKQGKHVKVYTPYIICGKEMYQDLTALTKQGTSVEMLTNDVASGANPWGCTDYLNQKKKIHKTGVKVYEFMGAHSSHTKAVLIDDRMSIVGSYNFDMRSTYQDTELMLSVDSEELNAFLQKEFARDKTYSKTMTEDGTYQQGENYVPKELSFGKKLFYGVLRIVVMPIRRFL